MTRKMPTHDVFLDTETGGLRWDDKVWELGMVVDRPATPDPELHLLHVADFNAADADPMALQLGGFFQRHPGYAGGADEFADHGLSDAWLDTPVRHFQLFEAGLGRYVEPIIRDARIIVCNAVFDVPRLTAAFARVGVPWTGHYRVICATTYAAGAAGLDPSAPNDAIGEALGVARGTGGTTHTALADSLYARELYLAALAKVGISQASTWPQTVGV